jgi:TRAP-type C4-dicarboxylate transport system permease small subunit
VLPGLDMVVLKMPKKVQVVLKYVVRVLMLALLVFFVHFGFKLAFSNLKRTFQTLGISYSWVTISLPVCSILMILSLLVTSFDEISQFAKR